MNWISVKDRLPGHHYDVLIRTKRFTATGIFYSDDKLFLDHRCNIIQLTKVTHWMPLPDKPTQDNLQLDKEDGLICPRYTGFNCLPDKPAEEG